ncbi:unnamed protein product [Coffea canephora]|uniref:WRKY domain-containing protein n=1 Tax=Coffea canephora TaxID=49390 RepID=A0A068U9W8_COFCA|nr:unnamed protein product [Coffea canephora]
MENSADWELGNLINELMLGRELAKQLQVHINAPSSSPESRDSLVHKILNSYEKALNMLKSNAAVGVGEREQSTGTTIAMSESRSRQNTGLAIGMSDSPRSLSASPHSDDSDREFRDQDSRDVSRKRKTMPRWTKHVQVCPGMGLEGPLDDGFSWRKYGQKDILGAKHPRGYYRCTHRHVQGCLATKQVQRSDEDPTIFEVTYRGRHTCNQGSEPKPPAAAAEKPETSSQGKHRQVTSQPQQNQQGILLSFQRDLKVNTKDLDSHNQHFPTFDFASTSTTKPETHLFLPSLTDNNFAGDLSPPFMTPVTSGSAYFSVSPTHISSYAENQNSYASESEFTGLISAATSTTNSPTVGSDFPFSQIGFDTNFTFDNSGFFS